MSVIERELGSRPGYPFAAIVGQEAVKTALILNAIDPGIGGVLVSGPKGSGKSLIVNSLSQILPEIEQVSGCPFHCSPNDPTNMCPTCLSRFKAGEKLPVERARMRVVKVPLSVTDDMLVGSIDMDRVVEEGVRSFRPGLLAEANQNILYIDEVNLLPDHITDSILDAAASGWNTVEREGVSVQHPSRFILVGTMNPEEGELRPQILDRFGIYAETGNMEDPGMRHLILERNEGFIADPSAFISKYMGETEGFRSRIEAARIILPEVDAPLEVLSTVADTCSRLRVDGFRPDIVSVRAAKALAAFHGRRAIASEEVSLSVQLALGHRTRRSGMDSPPSHREIRKALRRAKSRALRLSFGLKMPKVRGIIQLPKELFDRLMRSAFRSTLLGLVMFGVLVLTVTYTLETLRSALSPRPPNALILLLEAAGGGLLYVLINRLMPRKRRGEVAVGLIDIDKMNIEAKGRLSNPDTPMGERMGGFAPAKVRYGKGDDGTPEYGSKILRYLEGLQRRPKAEGPRRLARPARGGGYGGGRRTKATSSSRGRYAWYQVPKGRPRDVALVPTLMAAALNQSGRVGRGPKVVIRPEDVREKVREYRAPFSIVLLVDMSLSMTESVENVVQTIYDLHRDVYRQRDRVALIVFKGSKAYTLQHPTKNLDLVVDKLRKAGASDYTPLAAGLLQAWKALKQEKLRNRDAVPHLVVVSDGIVNVPLDEPRSPLTRRRYTSEAQADSLDVARLISKEGYKVQVVNTNHLASEAEAPQVVEDGMRIKLTPTQFLMELARLSRGKYIGLSLKKPVL